MDELDANILRMLQRGDVCVPKIGKIAQSLKVPGSTVHKRIDKLKKEGVISGYSAIVDADRVGKPLTVFALVKLQYPENPTDINFSEVIGQKIANSSPQIQEVHALTGDWELLVKIKARDHKDSYRIAKECIVPAGNVTKVNSLFSVATFKETGFVLPD